MSNANSTSTSNVARRLSITSIIALALCSSSPSHALFGGGGAIAGGSTEITQLLNKAELITSTTNQIQTALNTLNSFKQLQQQLVTLPQQAIDGILGDVGGQFKGVLDLYSQLEKTKTSYEQLSTQLGFDIRSISALNVSPSSYLLTRAKLAQAKGGVYQAAIDADQRVMDNAQTEGESLNKLIKANGQITSHLSGFQALANANVQVISTMQQMKNTLANSNLLAAKDKKENYDFAAAKASADAATLDLVNSRPAVNLNYKPLTEVTIGVADAPGPASPEPAP